MISDGKSLILDISYRMNNFRLTTNTTRIESKISNSRIQPILELPPLIVMDEEGRAWNSGTGKCIRETYIVKVIQIDGSELLFHTVSECLNP